MDLKELLAFQEEFDRMHAGKSEFFVKVTDDNVEQLEHLIVCLTGELGEFANLTKKIIRGDHQLVTVRTQMASEMADMFSYLLKICNQLDFDLEREYLQKMRTNEKRFRGFRKP
jgi:NTP pyrophosphatase (non-canonical NTP hydrolase)